MARRVQTDEEQIQGLAARVASWWDRAKITVMGLSILVAVLSTTWVLGGSQQQIKEQIQRLSDSIIELKAAFAGLTVEQKQAGSSIAGHDTRIGRLEEWRDTTRPDILLLKRRVMALERRALGLPPVEYMPEDDR